MSGMWLITWVTDLFNIAITITSKSVMSGNEIFLFLHNTLPGPLASHTSALIYTSPGP